jgi:hypothetical protein
MLSPLDRRRFMVNSLKAGAVAGLSDLAFVHKLPEVRAEDVKIRHKVHLTDDIEPLVRVIEDTPRDRLMNVVMHRIRAGVGYQQLLAALFLAGVRGIQPRPVGFKFHAVLVVNSAHLASMACAGNERWLPLFWGLDNFKSSQQQNKTQGNWMMAPVQDGQLPSAAQARARFTEAMDQWDEEGADRAVTTLARTVGSGEILELLWRYAARDFRDIGHKAIYAANAWRTLQTIGWRHAEPVLRSLAYALLEHEDGNPAERDAEPDRPWRENVKRAGRIRAGWTEGKTDPAVAVELLHGLRTASVVDACDQVVGVVNKGIAPASVWDALFLRAGELLMQQPGIIGVHCVTSINALHYGYQACGNDETRRLLLLQAPAFLALFHKRMNLGQQAASLHIDTLPPIECKARGAEAVELVLAQVSKDRMEAARMLHTLIDEHAIQPEEFISGARLLVFNKGSDSHDYKFSSAAHEDFYHASPALRGRYLATSVFHLHGTQDRDNPLIGHVREALGNGVS